MFLSVIVPVYNEVLHIRETLSKISNYLKNKEWNSEIIVVNDGSNDNSLTEIEQANIENLHVISFAKNLGKGAAVKAGMLAAQGEWLLFIDADYSTAIEELDQFWPRLQEGRDIIIGSRGLKESKVVIPQSKFKVCLGKAGNKLIQLLAVPSVKDSQCGFKLFNKKCLPLFQKQTLSRWGFDFEILFLARQEKFKILELPVTWENRPASRVKLLDYPKTFLELIKIRINYLRGIYEKE
ncbi:glycosyltransferase family 2 protein [Patescibacteria group bacterium]|nr:glycosyltransferase family 2 protein [Patescibacteria group bacterium]